MNKAPTLNSLESKKEYLQKHIGNDLQWLLRAATEWKIQKEISLCIPGYEVQVYAMDSAFMRARALFEFLTEDANRSSKCTECKQILPKQKFYYTIQAFEIEKPLTSDLYKTSWKNPLHSHSGIHLQARNNNEMLKTQDGSQKHLNEMPLDFANELCRLWGEFVDELNNSELKEVAKKCLNDAINNADNVRISINKNMRNYPKDCKLFQQQIIK